jgi:hypothetical protein
MEQSSLGTGDYLAMAMLKALTSNGVVVSMVLGTTTIKA